MLSDRLVFLINLANTIGPEYDPEYVLKQFVDGLAKHDSLYHFDDSAHNILYRNTNNPLFSSAEAMICNQIRDYLYDEGYGAKIFDYTIEHYS